MLEQLIDKMKRESADWSKFQHFFTEREISAKTVLLREGEISYHTHFIKKGCLRQWFNKDGKEITFQFFFEGQPVASIDSFMNSPIFFRLLLNYGKVFKIIFFSVFEITPSYLFPALKIRHRNDMKI